jgi:hypothetical protein
VHEPALDGDREDERGKIGDERRESNDASDSMVGLVENEGFEEGRGGRGVVSGIVGGGMED